MLELGLDFLRDLSVKLLNIGYKIDVLQNRVVVTNKNIVRFDITMEVAGLVHFFNNINKLDTNL